MLIEAYVLDGTVTVINTINKELEKLNNYSFKSVNHYNAELEKAKMKAFSTINNMSKPYVVYQVNRYFLSGERFQDKYFKKDLVVLE